MVIYNCLMPKDNQHMAIDKHQKHSARNFESHTINCMKELLTDFQDNQGFKKQRDSFNFQILTHQQ